MRQTSQSLATFGLILVAMDLVLAFIWWLIVFSPIGFGRAFEVLIGGEDLRNTFNTVFVVVLTVDAIAAIACFFLAGVKVVQDWATRLKDKMGTSTTPGNIPVEQLIEEASFEAETSPQERTD